MKISPRTILAAALLTALPMGGAFACTTDAWDVTTNAEAGNPKGRNGEPAVPRYSGTCALKAATAGTSYVTDNSPANEAVYRARFYVFTGSAAGNPKIFSATSEDAGAGTEAFSIALSGSALAFTVNGTTVSPASIPVVANKWYGVEVLYRAGGAFSAKVRGNNALTETTFASAGNAGSVNVGSARLGVLNAASNTTSLAFDAFVSTRSEDTEIGRLCPGDANGDNIVNSVDALAAINEFPPSGPYAAGQPDCTEDGLVNSVDALCAMNRFAVPAQRNCSVR